MARASRSRWQARRGLAASRRRLPALICALATLLSLTLNACASIMFPGDRTPTPGPSYPCQWSGEAAPPIRSYALNVAAPLVDDGVVYVTYAVAGAGDESTAQYGLAALRTRDGTTLWRSPPASNWTAPFAVVDGVLLVRGGRITGLRAIDGTTLWQAPLGSSGWSLLGVSGEALYAVGDNNTVYAIRVADGRILWGTPAGGPIAPSGIVAQGKTVYIGSGNGFLMALRADTGALLWKAFADPTHPAEGIYIPLGVIDGWLYVYYATSGEPHTIPASVLRLNPVTGGSAADALGPATFIAARDTALMDGVLFAAIAPLNGTMSSPDIAAYRLRESGSQLLWRLPGNGLSLSIIAHDATALYLRDASHGTIYAARLSDGKIRWRQQAVYETDGGFQAAAGYLITTASGMASCFSYIYQPPAIRAFRSADGGVAWTRTLDARL